MTEQYRIEQRDGYLFVEVTPEITFEGVVDAYAEVARMDGKEHLPRLWLLPEQASQRMIDAFSLDQLRQLVDAGKGHGVGGKAAIVTDSDVLYAKMRQLTMMRPDQPERFGVFREELEAMAWLLEA